MSKKYILHSTHYFVCFITHEKLCLKLLLFHNNLNLILVPKYRVIVILVSCNIDH